MWSVAFNNMRIQHISKIVSGGQTGADLGAIEAALYCELPWGGWIPKGRKCEVGAIPDRFDKFQEMTSIDYLKRTEANVADSDATLIFTCGKLSGGSKRTMDYALKYKKPVLHIAIDQYSKTDVVRFIKRWFAGDITEPTPPKGCVLNVAGSRESKNPGVQEKVMAIMIDVISELNGRLFYPIGVSDIAKAPNDKGKV